MFVVGARVSLRSMHGTLCVSTVAGTTFYAAPVSELPELVARLLAVPTADAAGDLLAACTGKLARVATLSTDVPTLTVQRRRTRVGSVYALRYHKADQTPVFMETLPMDPARAEVYRRMAATDETVNQLRTQNQRLRNALAAVSQQMASVARAAQQWQGGV